MSNSHELLSKTEILREYRIPIHMLDKAIKSGELRSIGDNDSYGRKYIPRYMVERWIESKVSGEETAR